MRKCEQPENEKNQSMLKSDLEDERIWEWEKEML